MRASVLSPFTRQLEAGQYPRVPHEQPVRPADEDVAGAGADGEGRLVDEGDRTGRAARSATLPEKVQGSLTGTHGWSLIR